MSKEYIASYTIYGTATAIVEADSKKEAVEKAKKLDLKDGSDSLNEWSFDVFEQVDLND